MKIGNCLIIIFLIFFCTPASAEFYKYTDESGSIRFTDDLSRVPVNQRPGVKEYIESESSTEVTAEDEKEGKGKKSAEEIQKEKIQGELGNLNAMKSRLDQVKLELESDFNALKEERAALEATKVDVKTNNDLVEYNLKMTSLNNKNAAFEAKRNSYEADVNSYREMVEKVTAESAKQTKTEE